MQDESMRERNLRSQTQHCDETTTPKAPSESAAHRQRDCPDCGAADSIVRDGSERLCDTCGLILDCNSRANNVDSVQSDSQTGGHYSGQKGRRRHIRATGRIAGTRIGHSSEVDFVAPSPRRRRTLKRIKNARNKLRKSKTQVSTERGVAEIERMMTSFGYQGAYRDRAVNLFRKSRHLTKNRCVESHAAAAVYATFRMEQVPVTLVDVVSVARVGKSRIKNFYQLLKQEVESVTTPPPTPLTYIHSVASGVDAPPELTRNAKALLKATQSEPFAHGHPAGLAAGAINALQSLTPPEYYYDSGEKFTISELADEASVSDATVFSATDNFEEYICGGDMPEIVTGEITAPVSCPV